MILIGSRAALVHFPDHRPPNDWDLIVSTEEHFRLIQLLGPPQQRPQSPTALRPAQSPTTIHHYQGQTYELKPEAHHPLWTWVLREPPRAEEGESVFTDPVLGEVRRASPALLLLLKQSGAVHPVRFWRKTLLDYQFLKARVPHVPVRMAEAARLACARMESRFARHSAVTPWLPAVCAPIAGAEAVSVAHASWHERFARGKAGPLAAMPGAWDGFPFQEPEARRALMVELLVEEALVLAAARQWSLPEPAPRLSLFNWTLRLLITQELPLRWAYFAVDEYRAIQSKLMSAAFPVR